MDDDIKEIKIELNKHKIVEKEIEEGKKKKDDEDDMKEGKKKDKEEKEKMKEELAEALSTVTSLKSTITETNLLNSKLLYCNKLFRANALTEAQKVNRIGQLRMGVIKVLEDPRYSPDLSRKYTVADMITGWEWQKLFVIIIKYGGGM